ncbi:MAG: hypothetical protein SF002_13770 [Alphaproteobacteria bacterium]|nr:hypothetical protein [Alphaproteobacteria bacterium]
MVKFELYLEGNERQQTEARRAFSKLFDRLRLPGCNRPKIFVSGSRNDALRDYETALRQKNNSMLLIDSEALIDNSFCKGDRCDWRAWDAVNKPNRSEHIRRPPHADDRDCHFFVTAMESWVLIALADQAPASVEAILPKDLVARLSAILKRQGKDSYQKSHAFDLLADADPAKIIAASPWAARFFDEVQARGTHASA